MKTKQIVLASRPKGSPTLDNFRLETVDVDHIKDGEVLIEGMY